MLPFPGRKGSILTLLALTLFVAIALPGHGQPCCHPTPQCVADLRKLSSAELAELFTRSELGNIPVGDLKGQMLHLTDKCLPKVKVLTSNLVWRGKYLGPDTYFSNRWIGNRRWIGAYYVIGPSWMDGKPAIILEYPPGTPFFTNLHDELREIAPGLYLGTVFERCPCPSFRGWFAIEIPKCKGPGCCP